jgi:hypothetical protein
MEPGRAFNENSAADRPVLPGYDLMGMLFND